jgi:uncharacterized membrane protein YgdD (TMEM256/DUF423 family)
MYKNILFIAAIFAAIAVALGAFGAHALEGLLNERFTKAYESAVKYQMYHALALLLCGVLLIMKPHKLFSIASKLFIAGIFLFSGSLYLLVFFNLKQISNLNFVGAITPIGGICLISGWICLALGAKKIYRQNT